MRINLENKNTGVIKQVKIGTSWTALFFCCWVPLFRADWKFFVIFLLVQILEFFTFGLAGLVIRIVSCVKYNDWYISELIDQGYRPIDDTGRQMLRQHNLYFRD